MAEEKKLEKLDKQIEETQNEYTSRSFSYDADSDKGYQEYARLMRENGRKAMEDTVGKASALTGGYANSYAATAGQQVYNDYAQQAAAAQGTYRQMAMDEYEAKNQEILNRLNVLKQQKTDLWNDAALGAQYGDYSKYIDMGVFEDEKAAKAALGATPNEAQIAYAKQIFAEQGMKGLDSYIASLDVGNADSLIDDALDGFADLFEVTYDGGNNHFDGLNNNAKLTFNGEEHTVKKWNRILQDKYGFTANEAHQFLLKAQEKNVKESK